MNNKTKIRRSAKCPNCQIVNNFEGTINQKIKIECPNCGVKGFFIFRPDKKTHNKIILTLALSPLVIFLIFLFIYAATNEISFKTIFISIFIGILLLKELIDNYISYTVKKKINIFIVGLFVIFLFIIIREIQVLLF